MPEILGDDTALPERKDAGWLFNDNISDVFLLIQFSLFYFYTAKSQKAVASRWFKGKTLQ